MAALDKRCTQLQKEKELIEKKMQRIEKAKETETTELRSQLELVQGDIQAQIKLKDAKITEVRGRRPRRQEREFWWRCSQEQGCGAGACGHLGAHRTRPTVLSCSANIRAAHTDTNHHNQTLYALISC